MELLWQEDIFLFDEDGLLRALLEDRRTKNLHIKIQEVPTFLSNPLLGLCFCKTTFYEIQTKIYEFRCFCVTHSSALKL